MTLIVDMAQRKGSTKKRKRDQQRKKAKATNTKSASLDVSRLEYLRHGLALIPTAEDKDPGIAFLIKTRSPVLDHFFCTCRVDGTCRHLCELDILAKQRQKNPQKFFDYNVFTQSGWYWLATLLAEECLETPDSVKLVADERAGELELSVLDRHKNPMLTFFSSAGVTRFKERIGEVPESSREYSRANAIRMLSTMVISDNERAMNNAGVLTRRQDLEKNFWYRFAYHAFREFSVDELSFSLEIDETTGVFSANGWSTANRNTLRLVLPKKLVKRILTDLPSRFSLKNGRLKVHPQPVRPNYRFRLAKEKELEISPFIYFSPTGNDRKEYDLSELTNFVYGDLVYLSDFGVMVELEKPRQPAPIDSYAGITIHGDRIPYFLDTFRKWNEIGEAKLDDGARNLKVHRDQLNLKITPDSLERDWYWLSFEYTFGQSTLSLNDIIEARAKNKRFLKVDDGWVDCQAPHFRETESIFKRLKEEERISDASKLKLTRLELLRLSAMAGSHIDVKGKRRQGELLRKFVNLQPRTPLPSLANLGTPLRHYQEQGVNWLRFLYENGLGGLLCDDMGLGKTHQIMALMTLLKTTEKKETSFLVVCPTTVISHWADKIREHAPKLNAGVYHSGERKLKSTLKDCDVIITSYGVFRNDIVDLREIHFALAVFDEAQQLKNQQTLAYAAALELNATVRIGLTGTPIENNVLELKALFDLVLPGYLGAAADFEQRFTTSGLVLVSSGSNQRLRALISPFILRRLKQTVLDELPPKIEDIRACLLSEDQTKLYREAISTKGNSLRSALESADEIVPYIHIFALLTILKQICDHPAVAVDKVEEYDRYTSGKWELFKELLAESLDSGQKVVVFSQFLGMIRIVEKYLTSQKVGFVTLTGASRKRRDIVSRFNEDEQCRVFVGSLMAGGTGIDLVAGSVVIHYDRWWNAAREDQATDRLHRIGQKNVVQVFKLITKGTLEEKISALIDRKKKLMESVVQEDDPNVLKTLSRQDLIGLISAPTEN